MEDRKSATARLWLDAEDILHVVATGEESTAESVAETFGFARELAGGRRVPILFDSRDWPRGNPSSWNLFISIIENICVAAAVVASPASAKAMGAFPELVNDLLIPFRVFADEEPALAFLRNHLDR